jgi:hypothetical protein
MAVSEPQAQESRHLRRELDCALSCQVDLNTQDSVTVKPQRLFQLQISARSPLFILADTRDFRGGGTSEKTN